MIKNYIIIAWRNLFRNQLTSVINIVGLTVGMTCFILIALYIQFEMSYDKHHEKADQIYRISQQQEGNFFRGTDRFTGTPSVLAPTLRNEFTDVQAATTLQLYEMPLEKDGHVFNEQGLFADEHLFDVFTFPILEGLGRETLRDPNAIILTKSLAKKYFGNEDPIGKTLSTRSERLLTVRGIIEDVPENQHFSFDFISSFKNLPFYEENRWNSNNFITYIVLPNGYDYKKFEEKLLSLDKYMASYKGLPFSPKFFLQPLLNIHLHSQINFEIGANNDMRNIWLFGSVAFVILSLASINYMNLTTARSSLRTKEVGMRKVLGARKGQLLYQFLGESFLLTVISFILAIALASMVLPSLNHLLGKSIPFGISGNHWLLIGLLIAALLLTALSGLYPAIFISTVLPAKAIRGGSPKESRGGVSLRNILVVGQFTSSIVLAIGSMVIYQQLQFVQHKKLGYNRENVVYVPVNDAIISDKVSTIQSELLKNTQIEKVSFPSEMPLDMGSEGIVNEWEGNNTKRDLFIYRNYVDYDFIHLFEIELLEGRNFSPDHPADSVSSYILNESAVKALGWVSAIGKQFAGGEVIGVVKDFHFQRFDLTIQPLYLKFRSKANGPFNIAVKIKMENAMETMAYIQQTIKTFSPHNFVNCRFLDDDYDALYNSETRLGQAFTVFTALALLIAGIGLFGLVSHHILRRTKEIGIRKVLGATTESIVALVSREFLVLVMISFLIASPVAWWAMNKWLQDFAYKIEIEWWMFFVSGFVAVSLALVTISFQSIKAALMNPVISLRSE
jgi:putative ABC transport system permease protein